MAGKQIIAEIGSVHDGSFGNAKKLMDAAAACGATSVKFQTHIPEAETLQDAPSPSYFSDEPRFDYFRRTGFSVDQWKKLADHARTLQVEFLSSPFSLEAVDLLESVGVQGYKIPSGEISNLPLLERVAETRKPVLLSSGMSDWAELDAAVAVIAKRAPLTVLQCSSIYPCPPERVGLNVLSEIKSRYGVSVGFSDHTTGVAASIGAAVLGADVIEKHFTFSRLMYGSDAKNSMEPEDFKMFCAALREAWAMRENPVDKNDVSPYKDMKRIFEKSVVTATKIAKGEKLTRAHLAFKKPGDGIRASEYAKVVGRIAKRDFPKDHKVSWEELS